MDRYLFLTVAIVSLCMVNAMLHVKHMPKWEIPYYYLHSEHDHPGSYTAEPPITGIVIDSENGTLNAFTDEKMMYFDLYEAADPKKNRYWLELPAVTPITPPELHHLHRTQKNVYGFAAVEIEGQASVQVGDWLYFWNSKNEEYSFQKYNANTREIITLPHFLPVRGSCLAYSSNRMSIFLFGGEVFKSGAMETDNELWEFIIDRNEWINIHKGSRAPGAISPKAVSFAGCAFDTNEEVFIVLGGSLKVVTTGINQATEEVRIFEIATLEWIDVVSPSIIILGTRDADKLYDLQCSLFSLDDNIYCVGGIYLDGSKEYISNAVYKLEKFSSAGTIELLTDLKLDQPRAGARLIEINKCLWIVGGYQATSISASSQPVTTIAGIGLGLEECKLYPPQKKAVVKCENCGDNKPSKGTNDTHNGSKDDNVNFWKWLSIAAILIIMILFVILLILWCTSNTRDGGEYQRGNQTKYETDIDSDSSCATLALKNDVQNL